MPKEIKDRKQIARPYFFKKGFLISVKKLAVNRQKKDIQQNDAVNVPLPIKPILLQEYVAMLLVFSFTATDNPFKKFLAYSSEPFLLTRLTERANLWREGWESLLNSAGKENHFFSPEFYDWANKTAVLCEKNNTLDEKNEAVLNGLSAVDLTAVSKKSDPKEADLSLQLIDLHKLDVSATFVQALQNKGPVDFSALILNDLVDLFTDCDVAYYDFFSKAAHRYAVLKDAEFADSVQRVLMEVKNKLYPVSENNESMSFRC